MKLFSRLIGAGVVLAALGCSGNKTQSVAPGPELFGTWRINRVASDSANGLRRSDGSGSRRRPGGARTGGAGMPGRGRPGGMGIPGGGMGRSPREDVEMWRVIDAWTRADSLTLAAAPNGVRITYPDNATIQLNTDGKTKKYAFLDFDDVESKAKWSHSRLEVEHRVGTLRISETFERPAGARLIVTTRILGGSRPMQIRRIYEPSLERSKL